MSKPIVAIVGRANVGKSTLFNRLTGKRVAIVEDTPGVTRDRIYGDCEWLGREFILVDTGGIEDPGSDPITSGVRRQAEFAINEADVVVFLVDARAGLLPQDEEVAGILRRAKKPVLLAVNKAEADLHGSLAAEFHRLGIGDPIGISAAHGLGTGDLLDAIVRSLPPPAAEPFDTTIIRVAVIGRPNVGKSSLVNAILGEERVIVSEVPGTTRDAVDTFFRRHEQGFVIIDTAGIRRKANINEPVEHYSVLRALRAVDRCDVAIVMIDATTGVTEQDKRIAGYAHEAGRAIIVAVNKWDLIEKDQYTMNRYQGEVRSSLGFLDYAPIIFISAKTGKRINELVDLVQFVAEQHAQRVATSRLNEVLEDALAMNPPPADKGRRLNVYYVTQVDVKPPRLLLFVNDPQLMHFSYLRFLENRFRAAFGFEGTPLVLNVRAKAKG